MREPLLKRGLSPDFCLLYLAYLADACLLTSCVLDHGTVDVPLLGGDHLGQWSSQHVFVFGNLGFKQLFVELAAGFDENWERITTGVTVETDSSWLVAVAAVQYEIEGIGARPAQHIRSGTEKKHGAEHEGRTKDNMGEHPFFLLD